MTYLELKTEISEAIGETTLSIYEDRIESLINDAFAELIVQTPSLKNSDIGEFISSVIYQGATVLTEQITEKDVLSDSLRVVEMENNDFPLVVERTHNEIKKARYNEIFQPTKEETFYCINDWRNYPIDLRG